MSDWRREVKGRVTTASPTCRQSAVLAISEEHGHLAQTERHLAEGRVRLHHQIALIVSAKLTPPSICG